MTTETDVTPRQPRRRRWLAITIAVLFLLPITLFAVAIVLMTSQQDRLVAQLLTRVNAEIEGSVHIEGSHIAPFANFPYISIDLEGLEVREDPAHGSVTILRIDDVYVGFDLRRLLRGVPEMRTVRIEGGQIDLIEHEDGTLNLANALQSKNAGTSQASGEGSGLGIDLEAVILRDILLNKYSEVSDYRAVIQLASADLSLFSSRGPLQLVLESDFELTVEHAEVPTFFRERRMRFASELSLDQRTSQLSITRSQLRLEDTVFSVAGTVDIENDMDLDLSIEGDKPNFDLFLAFAPPELAPLLARYESQGRIDFRAQVKGPSINGQTPAVNVDFGLEDGLLARSNLDESVRNLDESVRNLRFRAHFDNGDERSAATSRFTLNDFNADPAAGFFRGNIVVENFDNPDIDLTVDTDFDLDFLARFLGFEELFDLSGRVQMSAAFRELIDLDQPGAALARISESYATKLSVEDLRFRSPDWSDAFEDIQVELEVGEAMARLHSFSGRYRDAHVSASGRVTDLPALLRGEDKTVTTDLSVNAINLRPSVWRERLPPLAGMPILPDVQKAGADLRLSISGAALQQTGLPTASLLAENFYLTLDNGMVPLTDVQLDLQTAPDVVRQLRLTGTLGDTALSLDASFAGLDALLEGKAGRVSGDIRIDSPDLLFSDLMSVAQDPPLPDDWAEERVESFALALRAMLDVDQEGGLTAADVDVSSLAGALSVHTLPLEDGRGRVHWDPAGIVVSGLGMSLGESSLVMDYQSGDSDAGRPGRLSIKAPVLDFDALTLWSPPGDDEPIDHDAGFSLFDLEFPDLEIELVADRVTYHRMRIDALEAQLVTRPDHSGRIEILDMQVAGGHLSLKGEFNGEQRERVRFQPRLSLTDIDLDQLLFKFENFGQDHLISENLHGRLTGTVEGLVLLHADLTPIIDESRLQVDVLVRDGMLEDFGPLNAMSDFFRDRNLSRLRFGDLSNRLLIDKGVMEIPSMTVNTSLGFLELEGSQAIDGETSYLVRVPWRMVTGAAFTRLFGGLRRAEVDPDRLDEIQYRDPERKVRFITVRIDSDGDDWRVSLGNRR